MGCENTDYRERRAVKSKDLADGITGAEQGLCQFIAQKSHPTLVVLIEGVDESSTRICGIMFRISPNSGLTPETSTAMVLDPSLSCKESVYSLEMASTSMARRPYQRPCRPR